MSEDIFTAKETTVNIVEYKMTAEHSETGAYKSLTFGSITEAVSKATELRKAGWTVQFDREDEARHDSYKPKPERISHPSPTKRCLG